MTNLNENVSCFYKNLYFSTWLYTHVIQSPLRHLVFKPFPVGSNNRAQRFLEGRISLVRFDQLFQHLRFGSKARPSLTEGSDSLLYVRRSPLRPVKGPLSFLERVDLTTKVIDMTSRVCNGVQYCPDKATYRIGGESTD